MVAVNVQPTSTMQAATPAGTASVPAGTLTFQSLKSAPAPPSEFGRDLLAQSDTLTEDHKRPYSEVGCGCVESSAGRECRGVECPVEVLWETWLEG